MSEIIIPLIETRQIKSKPIYVGSINFEDLNSLAKVTFRKESDDYYYQRKVDIKRLTNIYNFMLESYNEKENLIVFPTPIILACSLDVVEVDSAVLDQTEDDHAKNETDSVALLTDVLLTRNGNSPVVTLTIPVLDQDRPLFIVDGQHRFEAVKKFKAAFPDAKFEFSVVMLLEYDLFQQAKIFANVNFNQKPVNRSLYYDIFGSLPDSPSDIKLAHFLSSHLDRNDNSPLKGMIKMLGTGRGIISQAFIVETLSGLFASRKGSGLSMVYNFYVLNDNKYKSILPVMENYFKFIKQNFAEYWPQPNTFGEYSPYYYKNYLLKTTGIFALLSLLDYLINDESTLKKWSEYSSLQNDLSIKFRQIIAAKVDFFDPKVSSFSGGGGKGLQRRLFDALRVSLIN